MGEETVVLSVLNGVTSEETLSQAFGPEKVLYAVAQGMDAVREDNRLTCTQEGTLFLGVPEEDYFDRGDKLEAVWSLFRQAGVDARKEADILHRMWCKFMLNVGVNQVWHGLCLRLWRRTGARPGSGYHDRGHDEAQQGRSLPGGAGHPKGPAGVCGRFG